MIKQSISSKVVNAIIYILLILLAIAFILPLWMVLVSSFVGEEERLARGYMILYPQHFDLSAYKAILAKNSQIYQGYLITLIRTVVGTGLSIFITAMLAYGLSKKGLPKRNLITFLIFFTSIFNPGIIPNYLVVKYTGLYDTIWALIIPNLVVAWWLLILRNFMMQIPESLEEAALIDGASPMQILLKIYMPLSVASLVTVGMFYAVWHWNSWFDGMIYVSNQKLFPAQVVLKNIIASSQVENLDLMSNEVPPPLESVKAAAIVVTTFPILCIYPFVQKFFVKGTLVGGVKG